jgi:DNA polymerase III gamma/tau subunit
MNKNPDEENLKAEKVSSYIFYGSNSELAYAAVKDFAKNAGISEFDTVEIEPEAGDKNSKGEIGVKVIRDMIRQINLTPGHGSGKLAIIKGADRLGLEAANTLLKTLEEPPGAATIILLSSDLKLLPTIRSRCQIVRCDDSVTSADEEILAQFRETLKGNLKKSFKAAEKMSTDADLEQKLNVIISSLRNQLQSDASIDKVRVIKSILAAKRNLKITTNKRLVLENLFMEIKYKNA